MIHQLHETIAVYQEMRARFGAELEDILIRYTQLTQPSDKAFFQLTQHKQLSEIGEAFRQWQEKAREELGDFFDRATFDPNTRVEKIGQQYGIDFSNRDDFIKFYLTDITMSAIPYAGEDPTEEEFDHAATQLEELSALANKATLKHVKQIEKNRSSMRRA